MQKKFTLKQLNDKVNDEETLLDFIRNSEKAFDMDHRNVFMLDDEGLTNYDEYLDDLWNK